MTDELYEKITETGFRAEDFSLEERSGEDAYDGSLPVPSFRRATWTNSLIGIKFPTWRQNVRAHANATTPLDAVRVVMEQKSGRFVARANTHPAKAPSGRIQFAARGCIGGLPFPLVINSAGVPAGNAANEAAGAWYGKVRNAMSGFKGLTFAAEALDAKRMMFDRGSRMIARVPVFQDLLRKRWVRSRTKRGKLKTLSNSWLELQFGWLPLASDIEDAYKVLESPTPQYKRVKAEAFHSEEESSTEDSSGQLGVGSWSTRTRVHTRYYVVYRGEVMCRADPAGSKLLDFGLGAREFLPTIWEVIPWSFAIDYFTNVSEIINSACYASTDVTWVNMTVRQSRTKEIFSKSWITPGNYSEKSVVVDVPSSFKVEATRVTRAVPGVIPIPKLQFQLPSWKQSLNLAALAVSRRLRLSY